MFQDMPRVNNGGGAQQEKEVTTITGKAAQTRTFSATIGHKYIVAFDCLTSTGLYLDGLDVVADSGDVKTREYNGLYAKMSVIIGIATKTTVTCSWRTAGDAHYNNIIWIDLDDQ